MTPDPLHTIIARQQAGNAYFLIVVAFAVLTIIGVGLLGDSRYGG